MYEQKQKVVNHPLFGEIQVSQGEKGNTLYRGLQKLQNVLAFLIINRM